MTIIDQLLKDVSLPPLVRARQIFPDTALQNPAATLREQLQSPSIAERIPAGARIALAVGSRGMNRLPELVSCTVKALKERGAKPFIVPAMGSHGGATAAGQTEVLAALGVTEQSAGCPIISSMETVTLGTLDNGLPVAMDQEAQRADGIVLINRIKPHTSFSGPWESGLVKMLAIGLGKQKGADSCHAMGFGSMAQNIVDMAKVKLAKSPILFGVATIENAYDRVARVEVLKAEEIITREQELLTEAREQMPRILFDSLDVLVIDEMGKNFSGTGTDPHVTGRAATPYVKSRLQVNKMVVLDLSEASHGNATGVGLADICTRRLVDKINFPATYANHITSTVLAHGKIPVTMENDRRALQLALKTCNALDPDQLRLVRIVNTLQLEQLLISPALAAESQNLPGIELSDTAVDWNFDRHDLLTDIGCWS